MEGLNKNKAGIGQSRVWIKEGNTWKLLEKKDNGCEKGEM